MRLSSGHIRHSNKGGSSDHRRCECSPRRVCHVRTSCHFAGSAASIRGPSSVPKHVSTSQRQTRRYSFLAAAPSQTCRPRPWFLCGVQPIAVIVKLTTAARLARLEGFSVHALTPPRKRNDVEAASVFWQNGVLAVGRIEQVRARCCQGNDQAGSAVGAMGNRYSGRDCGGGIFGLSAGVGRRHSLG